MNTTEKLLRRAFGVLTRFADEDPKLVQEIYKHLHPEEFTESDPNACPDCGGQCNKYCEMTGMEI